MGGKELINKRTRNAFREVLVSSTLRQIGEDFEAAGVTADSSFTPSVSGKRRCYVEQFYYTLDFTKPEDVDRLLEVYENILTGIESRIAHPDGRADDLIALRREFDGLTSCLRKDGYAFSDGRLTPTALSVLKHLRARATAFDAEYLAAQVQRLEAAVDSDPDLAIGQAKELVETCCKTILSEHGTGDFDKLEIHVLVRKTAEALRLLPDHVAESAKGARSIKAVLGNLATIAQGLAELRNLYGTGHGKHGRAKGLSKRHARLAVGAATTLASFLFETHSERSTLGGAPT